MQLERDEYRIQDDVKQSTNLHAIMFTLIGDEYWLKLFRERKEK